MSFRKLLLFTYYTCRPMLSFYEWQSNHAIQTKAYTCNKVLEQFAVFVVVQCCSPLFGHGRDVLIHVSTTLVTICASHCLVPNDLSLNCPDHDQLLYTGCQKNDCTLAYLHMYPQIRITHPYVHEIYDTDTPGIEMHKNIHHTDTYVIGYQSI